MTHVDCTRIGDELIELLMGVVFAYEMMIMMMMMMMMIASNDTAETAFPKFTRNFLAGRSPKSSN
jgi:hypothetical protein